MCCHRKSFNCIQKWKPHFKYMNSGKYLNGTSLFRTKWGFGEGLFIDKDGLLEEQLLEWLQIESHLGQIGYGSPKSLASFALVLHFLRRQLLLTSRLNFLLCLLQLTAAGLIKFQQLLIRNFKKWKSAQFNLKNLHWTSISTKHSTHQQLIQNKLLISPLQATKLGIQINK